ncbi:acylphosphatase [Acidothermaceae bacterium B102]|nr:acylphosphatase [Acidothermaceae bacterium B102]
MSDSSHDSTAPAESAARLTVWLTGDVQGVGMRWWVRARALELGLVGSAANRADGRVEVVAEGPRAAAEELLALLRTGTQDAPGGRPGAIRGAVERWDPARGGLDGFRER